MTSGGARFVKTSLRTAKIFKQRCSCERRSEVATVMENLMKVDQRDLKNTKAIFKMGKCSCLPVGWIYICCVFVANWKFGFVPKRKRESFWSCWSCLILKAVFWNLLPTWRLFNSFLFSACAHHAALECERSGDEKKAGGTHRGPPPGPWTASAQHLLSLLVWLLQVSLVKPKTVCYAESAVRPELKSAQLFIFQCLKSCF